LSGSNLNHLVVAGTSQEDCKVNGR